MAAVVASLAAAGCSGGAEAEPAQDTAAESSQDGSIDTNTTATIDAVAVTTRAIDLGPTVPLDRLRLELELVADLAGPVALAPRPGTSDLYVVEQRGQIVRLIDGDRIADEAVLDIRGSVSGRNEQGLLGLVFSTDGERLFINYTDTGGRTTIVRYDMLGAVADLSSAVEILSVAQPRANHNGGHLLFGPDGYLYIGLGDGGGGGDPNRNGQNPATLLGSMLRIDPTGDRARPYEIPPDNPFANARDGAPEVFAWGVRNPWRYAFDAANGDLWIADVGQDRFEEVTVLRAVDGGGNGANLGWNEVEGDEGFRGGQTPVDHAAPLVVYSLTSGRCSVTGGDVYRGTAIPSLVGTYVFGDFCTGEIFGIDAAGVTPMQPLDIDLVSELTSFGTDLDGEIYALSRGGTIFRIVERS